MTPRRLLRVAAVLAFTATMTLAATGLETTRINGDDLMFLVLGTAWAGIMVTKPHPR